MRYYAEWLDGEYVLLDRLGYHHADLMQRAMRIHALFGSTVVLSDVQMLDYRTPVPAMFLDPKFRSFVRENDGFLGLVAEPIRGAGNEKFAIAMKGLERISDQANKPEDSYEMAITRLGAPIFREGSFEAARYRKSINGGKDEVGKVIEQYPKYQEHLKGLIFALDYFSNSPITERMPANGQFERYDTILRNALTANYVIDERQALRIDEILRIQDQHLPQEQHGRRAAIRKVLGTGRWHEENWDPSRLRLYLDVVHAWNCAINRSIAPEAGTLYESSHDLPLSRYERSITDRVGWVSAGPMPASHLSDRILRFLSWDPLESDWSHIAFIARQTRGSAHEVQEALKTGSADDRQEALKHHASKIADHLVNLPEMTLLKCGWEIAKIVGNATDLLEDSVEKVFDAAVEDAPYAYAWAKYKMIVNTIVDAGRDVGDPPKIG